MHMAVGCGNDCLYHNVVSRKDEERSMFLGGDCHMVEDSKKEAAMGNEHVLESSQEQHWEAYYYFAQRLSSRHQYLSLRLPIGS